MDSHSKSRRIGLSGAHLDTAIEIEAQA